MIKGNVPVGQSLIADTAAFMPFISNEESGQQSDNEEPQLSSRCPMNKMIRLQWSDSEPDDRSEPVDWRCASLILATLFLNFSFCVNYGLAGCCSVPLPSLAVTFGAAALLLAALFFTGPAMAVQASRLRVFGAIENSFGSIPTLALRLCAIVVTASWIADLLAAPSLWALSRVPAREPSTSVTGLMAAGLLVFLFLTGSRNFRTSARLAVFTCKLCLAVLIAAFIRVHDGWAAIPAGFPAASSTPTIEPLWYELSRVAFYAAPLALMAADFAFRQERKHVAFTGLAGIALPLFIALSFSGAIGVATLASGLYRPSLNPTVAMALFSDVAKSATRGRMLVAAITTFGALRFAVRALLDSAPVRPLGKSRWILIGCLIAAIAGLALRPYGAYAAAIGKASEAAATCLTIAGAVLTADFLTGWVRLARRQSVDWVGGAALLAGLAIPYCHPYKYVWGVDHYWLLRPMPPYTVAFFIGLCGRPIQKALAPSEFVP
jgi:hypothetical protein